MSNPLLVEVIAYAPTGYYHCTHCEVAWREMGVSNQLHEEQVENSLPDDLIREFQDISDWIWTLSDRYGCDLVFKIVDAASIEGVWKSLRYHIRRYPAVIVNHQVYSPKNSFSAVTEAIDQLMVGHALPE